MVSLRDDFKLLRSNSIIFHFQLNFISCLVRSVSFWTHIFELGS